MLNYFSCFQNDPSKNSLNETFELECQVLRPKSITFSHFLIKAHVSGKIHVTWKKTKTNTQTKANQNLGLSKISGLVNFLGFKKSEELL